MFLFLNEKRRCSLKKLKSDKIYKDTIACNKLRYKYFWLNGYSKPIYLKNGSICLLYHFEICSKDCGLDEIWFIKRENGNWIKWIKVSEGAF